MPERIADDIEDFSVLLNMQFYVISEMRRLEQGNLADWLSVIATEIRRILESKEACSARAIAPEAKAAAESLKSARYTAD